jgi:hypothetical protein
MEMRRAVLGIGIWPFALVPRSHGHGTVLFLQQVTLAFAAGEHERDQNVAENSDLPPHEISSNLPVESSVEPLIEAERLDWASRQLATSMPQLSL